MKSMRRLILTGLITIFTLSPLVTEAADLIVRPFLIDRTAEARDIVQEEVTLTNETSRKINVYATVNEITVDQDGDIKKFVSPIMTDRTNTVTSWVEISRARIELWPGDVKTIPLKLRIHPHAEPGEYHVFVGFGIASKRYIVEEKAMKGELDGVIVKVTIEDKSTEHLRLSSFQIDRFITGGEDKKVEIEIENLGDVSEVPTGEIIFLDSKGQELKSIPVNTDSLSVSPGETITVVSELPFSDELGRYKANLTLQYGNKQKAQLYDSTQFFMLPMHILLLMLLAAILLSLLIFFLLHRALAFNDDDDEHGADLPFYVRDGHNAEPKQHDIDLSNKE